MKMASSCSLAVSPSSLTPPSSIWSARLRAPTCTMKNSSRLVRHRAPTRLPPLGRRHPLNLNALRHHQAPAEPPDEPDLEQGPAGCRGNGTQQADLTIGAPELRAQHEAAPFLATAAGDREHQRPAAVSQRNLSLLQRHHRHLAILLHRARQRLALERLVQFLGALALADQQGAHVVVVAERTCQPLEPGPPATQRADLELLKRPGEPPAPNRKSVV